MVYQTRSTLSGAALPALRLHAAPLLPLPLLRNGSPKLHLCMGLLVGAPPPKLHKTRLLIYLLMSFYRPLVPNPDFSPCLHTRGLVFFLMCFPFVGYLIRTPSQEADKMDLFEKSADGLIMCKLINLAQVTLTIIIPRTIILTNSYSHYYTY
jgi:hypothetical protein